MDGTLKLEFLGVYWLSANVLHLPAEIGSAGNKSPLLLQISPSWYIISIWLCFIFHITQQFFYDNTQSMSYPTLPKRTIGAPTLGDKVAFTRTLTEADVALFIGTTWDVNPLHTDEIYCSGTQFQHRIVPGLLTASLLTHLGGLWAFLATEMEFKFLAPVYLGDSIKAEASVAELDAETGTVLLLCTCTNQNGKQVLTANVRGFPGKFE